MTVRTSPQNRLFHALVRDVARARPLTPWRRAFALEAWKRYFLGKYMREARQEAFAAGGVDPFPERIAQSSGLETWQMNELIECTYAIAAQQLDLVLVRDEVE